MGQNITVIKLKENEKLISMKQTKQIKTLDRDRI